MPTRFAFSYQHETRFQSSPSSSSSDADADADRLFLLAPSFALFSISEVSEVKDMSCRSSWGSISSRKSYRSNLSGLGNHQHQSSSDQLHPSAADQQEVPTSKTTSNWKADMLMNRRPQSPTTSLVDDDSWGFYEESDDIYNQQQ